MLKKEARKIYKAKRQALSLAEKDKLDDLMLIQFQALDLPFLHTVFSYWPMEETNEPETHLFTGFLEFRNPALRIAYPKINEDGQTMDAVLVHADTGFEKSIYNTLEPVGELSISPTEIDLVIVPLLVCDLKGYRVGYGKGFYDKYLRDCRPDCIKAGFLHFEPIAEISDTGEFDVPLDLCITPHNVYVF